MDIQYAILGLLSWQPATGYDLKKLISDSDLFYWSGNNNQIYYALIQLHKDGLISQEVVQQENLPAKKIYTITSEGLEALRQWSVASPEVPDFRNPFLIQLAWTDSLSIEEILALLDQYEEELSIQVRMRMRKPIIAGTAPDRNPREQLIWRKIEENLSSKYQHELDWLQDLRKELQKLEWNKRDDDDN